MIVIVAFKFLPKIARNQIKIIYMNMNKVVQKRVFREDKVLKRTHTCLSILILKILCPKQSRNSWKSMYEDDRVQTNSTQFGGCKVTIIKFS